MSQKLSGLYKKYEVKKITNPQKKVDCIVLEFDDPIERKGIVAFAAAAYHEGYKQLAFDLWDKLEHTDVELLTNKQESV